MKAFLVLALVAAVYARPEPPVYGAPSSGAGFSSGFGGFSGGFSSGGGSGFGGGSGGFGGGSAGGQTFRHVYVHAAPDEPVDQQSRVIRVPGGQDKHVNIIFVKTPSSSSSQQTEVILPEQNEQKTLVYVLLKKGENNANVRIRQPAKSAPQKPEVYFIRYKNEGGNGGGNGGGYSGGSSSGGYSGGSSAPSSAYGAPF